MDEQPPMTLENTAFKDLPKEVFPFTITFYRTDNDEEVWSETVEGPSVVYIPPLAKLVGVPVYVKTLYATGEEIIQRPEELEEND